MTSTTPRPGEQLHFLAPATISTSTSFAASGATLDRGDQITLTEQMIELNRDRFGALPAWLTALDDDDAQIAA